MSNVLPTTQRTRSTKPQKSLARITFLLRKIFRRLHPAWYMSIFLLLLLLLTNLPSSRRRIVEVTQFLEADGSDETTHDRAANQLLPNEQLVRQRYEAVQNQSTTGAFTLGNHFCVLQPTLSAGKSLWTEKDARSHIALRAFLRTFASTVSSGEKQDFRFSIYYGHDSNDAVFGNATLRAAFEDEAQRILGLGGFEDGAVRLVFTPMYGLHGRINAIWNVLAKDAYYDGCDYFFMSNDDMVFFTQGWVARSRDSLSGIGSPANHKRPCKYFGIVRFKDEWANWATFTFHVSTKLHMEIFGGTYYAVPYETAHNDYWIHYVYAGFDASKYRGEVRVRNRVEDVDYALAHPKDQSKVAPPRYDYGKKGDVKKLIMEGRARVSAWLLKHHSGDRCQPIVV